MTRRPSFAPLGVFGGTGRPRSASVPEIVPSLDDAAADRRSRPADVDDKSTDPRSRSVDAPSRETPLPPRSERLAVVSANPTDVVARVAPGGNPALRVYRTVDEIPATTEALVVVIADDVVDRDGDGALRRLRGRAPAAKLLFLARWRDDARSRMLAAWGAVLPPSADSERVASALRHASSLSTMAAELRRLRQPV